jgi:hypothetical protein
LQSISGLTTAADKMIYTTAADTYAVTDLTAAGRAILDDADASAQRTTLGLAIGTNVQAYDAGLQSISGLTTAADKMIYTTAADTYAVTDLTAAGRAILDDADAAAQRTTLGLVIGTNVQAYDAGLQSIAGLTTVADRMIYTTASDTYAVTTLTAAGRAILDDADAAAQRTTLGLAIGTNVQAYDAGLQSIAGLTTAADRMIYTTASDTYAVTTLTAAGRAILDDADAAAQRTTLGLTALATTTPGTNVATFLTTPSSANLAAAVTDETGSGALVFAASPTFTGTVTTAAIAMADNLLTRSVLKDYAIEGSAVGNTGATETFDLTNANFFSATLDQASTFTFSNPPASGDFGTFVLELTNGGAFAITWPASVDWPGGTAPTLTAAGKDQLVFTTRDGGTTYLGFVAGLDIK